MNPTRDNLYAALYELHGLANALLVLGQAPVSEGSRLIAGDVLRALGTTMAAAACRALTAANLLDDAQDAAGSGGVQ